MDDILRGLKDLVTGDKDRQPDDLVPPDQQAPYGNPAEGQTGYGGEVLSSDQDPYGDPGLDVRSSDEDPYGDPGANVLSSDQDPYGDPGARR